MRLTLLGPPEITHSEVGNIALSNRKALALLAYLAVESGHAHSRESLLGLLWPELPDADARNNLRVTWSQLSAKLGPAPNSGAPWLVSSRLDLQARPGAAQVDVGEFQQLLKQCEQHAHASRETCPECRARLSRAASLYQAEFMAGFYLPGCPAFEEWMHVMRERLHVQVVTLLDELTRIHAQAEDLPQAEACARRQIALDPLRESAHRQLMRALADQSERGAAMAAFEHCRASIKDGLGLDPEPETLALQARIASDAGARAPAGAASNLPFQTTSFIGRDDELAQLRARFAQPRYRLLSIVGPGGAGKTRLALEAATQNFGAFRDGAYFVPLSAVQSFDLIPAAIADVLDLPLAAGQTSALEQLIRMIGARHVLLVLDSFEHLIEGAPLLGTLVHRLPNISLLVTSRERLNMQIEDLFELEGLPVPADMAADNAAGYAAVRLFVDRAHRLNKHFRFNEAQRLPVMRICRLVDGLPLALELAATLIDDYSCDEIVRELESRMHLLETGLRDITPEHRSLRAVFDASWKLLTDSERRALAGLSVFRGGCGGAAARVIIDAGPAVLTALRNKSLLRSSGSRRYDMHVMVRQFAAEALQEGPADAAAIKDAHARYFLNLLASQAVALDTWDARAAADLVQPDWENILAAWQRATAQGDTRLLHDSLNGLLCFCNLRGLFQEAQTLIQDSAARVSAGADANGLAHCRLLTAAGFFAGRRGNVADALALSEQGHAMALRLNGATEIVDNLITQAAAYEVAGDYPQGIARAEEALALARAHADEIQVGICLHILGIIALITGGFERAIQLLQGVVEIHSRTGRLELRARAATGHLGNVAAEQGRYDLALTYSQRYLDSCVAMDDRRNIAHAQHLLAYLWLRLGEYERSIAFDVQCIARSMTVGDREQQSFASHTQSWASRHLGHIDDARDYALRAMAIAREIDARLALAFGTQLLAEAQLETASSTPEWEEGTANFRVAASIMRAIGKEMVALEVDLGLAELHRRRGDLPAALALVLRALPHLPTHLADGWDEPIRAHVVCIEVLRAAHDPDAARIHHQGRQLLDNLAGQISDPAIRRQFLSANPAHRALLALALDQVAPQAETGLARPA